MNVSIVIATHGDLAWADSAWSFAYPSAGRQDALEVLVEHHPDATLAEARNGTASKASGEWLCFLDADDQLAPGYLDAMKRTVEEQRLGGQERMYFSIRQTFGEPSLGQLETTARLSVADALLVPAVEYVDRGRAGEAEIPSWGRSLIDVNCAVIGTLIPRALFERVGGFREFPMYEDWDLWLRAVIAGASLVPVVDAVYLATVSRGRNSGSTAAATYWRIRHEHERAFTARGVG